MVISREEYVKTRKCSLPIAKEMPVRKEKNQGKTSTLKIESIGPRKMNVAAPRSVSTKARFVNPLLTDTVVPKQHGRDPIPRHDPNVPAALVMRRPTDVDKGKRVVDVVVDPLLSKHLREHQRSGVRFLYECVMGVRPYPGQGAILADEMGLGKTLQTIALLWTLLKQNPLYEEPPVVKKALVVCPATLVSNWRKEFRKWLGNERIGAFVADGSRKLTDFTHGKSYHVMVIGYERLRTVQEELKEGTGIDIVVADEGHRLKTAQNKSAQAIKALDTPRRIILSGTPIQNDLSEFFAMVDFVNPGIVGTYAAFKREFEVPILRSRQPGATSKDVEKGTAKSEELATITSSFILRRTAELIAKFLPPKAEYVLLCQPTAVQIDAYRAVLQSSAFSGILGSPEASLQLITVLKKVCNNPGLLARDSEAEGVTEDSVKQLLFSLTRSIRAPPKSAGAKLQVLGRLLHHLHCTTPEKIVLVSNYTSTLDLLQTFLTANDLPFLRLDGSTPSSKRQDLVDSFNRAPASLYFAFLLSAKAGGTGLNLIGASRLVLFDIDWNPSTDLQAMARIHRDGQKRPVKIYRLLVAGSMDEKIWQRQVTKMGLADSVMDQKASVSSFSAEELRDLFTLDTASTCQTHDLLGCKCGGHGGSRAVTVTDDADGKSEHGASLDAQEVEEAELPSLPTLIKASHVNMDKQERLIQSRRERAASSARAKGNSKSVPIQSLMKYVHIDTSKYSRRSCGTDANDESDHDDGDHDDDNDNDHEQPEKAPAQDVRELIGDDILLDVLQEECNRVKFVFAKTSC